MLTIYGATGYTGRLICELLASRLVEFTIAGRNRERLELLRASLAQNGRAPDVVVAALDDAEALLSLAQRSKVILSCAGPFAQMGPPVIEACLRGGAHYLDITGEIRFMIATAERDAAARSAKIALVNAVGFDVVPSDLVVALATAKLGARPDVVELGLSALNATPSGGTLRSLMGVLADGSVAWVDGRYIDEAVGSRKREFPFPGQLGDNPAYNAPFGDLATIPRTAGARTARTYFAMPPIIGLGARLSMPIVKLMRRPLQALAERFAPPPGEGPDLEARGSSRFAFVAEARRGSDVARVVISGADGYGLTAYASIHAALSMCDPAYDRSGALSPTQAVDPSSWRALFEKHGCVVRELDM